MTISESKSPSNLLPRIVMTVAVIVGLLIVWQLLTFVALSSRTADGTAINISGRQRMLSQQITKGALELTTPNSARASETVLEELEASVTLWAAAHEALQTGSAEFNLTGNNSQTVVGLFADIQPQHDEIVSAAQCIVALEGNASSETECSDEPTAYVQVISANEADFLQGMDAIVNQYEVELAATERTISLYNLLFPVLIAVVGVGSSLFVLRPLTLSRNRMIDELGQAQKNLTAANAEARTRADRLQTLVTVSQSRDLPLKQQIEDVLRAVLGTIGADIGIVSRIEPEEDRYTVMYHVSPEGALEDGQEFLFKRTFCETTLTANDVVAIEHTAKSALSTHPCYADTSLESYIGVPITVDGKRYGTLNFSSPNPHDVLFTEGDKDFVRVMGDWVSRAIERDNAQKKLEEQNEQLRRASAMAKEANRLKSEFLATMSHELRTPLNAVIGFAEIMLNGMGGDIDDDAHHMVERMHANSTRLLSLINDVLDMAKIEARRVEINYAPLSLRGFVSSLSNEMSSLAASEQVRFITKIDAQLPERILADEPHLHRVAVNLLSNAFKFTTEGTVSLLVRSHENDQYQIVVQDTGTGIPAHQKQVIFEPFRQADGSSKRSYAGTGLGLAITQELVRAMEGFIVVDSELGIGSTFTVTLPLRLHESEAQPEGSTL